MEDIDLLLTPDDLMPPSIEDDEDSEGDILFERLLHDDPIPFPDTLDFSHEVRIFLPFFTYLVTYPVLLSSWSEDKIFDIGITEFVDKLAHIISPPEYDRFYFWDLPDPGELMSVLNSGIRENLSSTTRVNLSVEDDHSPLLAYVVSFLLISRIPLFLLIFTHSRMKIPSLTQASPLIIFIRLSLVYLIGVELSRNSILTVVT
nr:hypothetical protein [Tanacetum cinerariifolium]